MQRDVAFLHELVGIPSPTGSTEKAAETFVREAQRRGFDEAFVDEVGNAVAVAGRGPREVLLVGHIDTVPGDLPVALADGWLTGRGSVDAKGPLCTFLAASQPFIGREDVRVVVVGCMDEEEESHGARHLIPRHRPEALVIGEPSGIQGVTIGYKGIVKVRYALEDDGIHTGAPFASVPDRGLALWAALQGWLARQYGDSLFTTPTAKLTSFQTLSLPNGRDRIELRGSVRTPPGFDTDALLDFLRARAGQGELDIPEVSRAWLSDKNSLLARAFVASIRAQGLTPRYVRKTGTSDMNLLAPAWQVPCIAYGPGDASLDHTPQERLRVSDFLTGIAVVRGSLGQLAPAEARAVAVAT
ncbi:MAG: M20/M25/M40 family metallo-hydrolase [Halobacteriales archaeon]|nr:M20/M25/M40 family metallo-hydrolase [Halobacteriales archaeon]